MSRSAAEGRNPCRSFSCSGSCRLTLALLAPGLPFLPRRSSASLPPIWSRGRGLPRRGVVQLLEPHADAIVNSEALGHPGHGRRPGGRPRHREAGAEGPADRAAAGQEAPLPHQLPADHLRGRDDGAARVHLQRPALPRGSAGRDQRAVQGLAVRLRVRLPLPRPRLPRRAPRREIHRRQRRPQQPDRRRVHQGHRADSHPRRRRPRSIRPGTWRSTARSATSRFPRAPRRTTRAATSTSTSTRPSTRTRTSACRPATAASTSSTT